MIALKRRRPAAEMPQPEVPEPIDETPVMAGLAKLIALAEREGIAAAAAALEADPNMLGLARAVAESDVTAAAAFWEHSAPSRSYMPNNRYEKAMGGMGLSWCSYPSEFLRDGGHSAYTPPPDFRISECRHPSGQVLPVIVVPVINQLRVLTGCQLLFVAPDWSGWADVEPKTHIIGRVEGQVLCFARPAGSIMVAPSFQTAAMGHKRFSGGLHPVWVSITEKNLAESFVPPDRTHALYLLHSTEGEREAAIKAAARIRADRHMTVELLDCPPEEVEDWRD